jgi:hypothetical protein
MSRQISRRLILRSAAGVSLALPFLESVARADTPPPKRFVGMYMPNGVFTPKWFPIGSETSFAVPEPHAALAPLKEHVLWLSGLNSAVAVQGEGEQHQRGLGAMLTGSRLAAGTFVGNDGTRAGWARGASIDQQLVGLIGQGTRVGSVQLGVNARERDVSGALSYAGEAQPLLPENSPLQTFRTLFMDAGPTPMLEGIKLKRASILDTVLLDFNALRKRVPPKERMRLDEHAQKVRELEARLTRLDGADGGTPMRCAPPSAPPMANYETEASMNEAARLQLELLALAFSCDITRVGTVMFSDAKNHISMPFLNINSGVHNVSHYGDSDPMREQLVRRDKWVVDNLAAFLTLLRDTREGNGTVLDNTLVFLGSDVARGNLHNHEDMPFLVAGHATGWRMGRYVKYQGLPHNNLLLSMFKGYGANAQVFGDQAFCSGPLSNLT